MQISSVVRSAIICCAIFCHQAGSLSIARPKDYRSSTPGEVIASKEEVTTEPSCEELKAMWRFSKRQSRAAEITNEIPTYRDPFSYNVWEPYPATSRSIGGMRIGYKGRPVYGRVVHKVPILRIQDIAERNRAFEEITRKYGAMQKPPVEPRRRMAFRLSGGGPPMGITPQSGSFQHLKELIRTERARELQAQRLAEEAVARNEALKEMTKNGGPHHRNQMNFRNAYAYRGVDGARYGGGEDDDDVGQDDDDDADGVAAENLHGPKAILAFPDLLAPAARFANPDEAPFIEDYSYFKDRPRNHRSMFHRGHSVYNNMDGYIL